MLKALPHQVQKGAMIGGTIGLFIGAVIGASLGASGHAYVSENGVYNWDSCILYSLKVWARTWLILGGLAGAVLGQMMLLPRDAIALIQRGIVRGGIVGLIGGIAMWLYDVGTWDQPYSDDFIIRCAESIARSNLLYGGLAGSLSVLFYCWLRCKGRPLYLALIAIPTWVASWVGMRTLSIIFLATHGPPDESFWKLLVFYSGDILSSVEWCLIMPSLHGLAFTVLWYSGERYSYGKSGIGVSPIPNAQLQQVGIEAQERA